MRLRLLKDVRMAGASNVLLTAGSVVDVPADVADKWRRLGVAMMDKSMDGATEHKAEPVHTPKKRTRRA